MRAITPWTCLFAVLIAAALPGCSGCREDPAAKAKREAEAELAKKKQEAESQKKKAEHQDDFTIGPLLAQPNEHSPLGGAVKPGHWIGVSQVMRANKTDFNGAALWQSVDGQGRPIIIPRQPNPFSMDASRPVSLAHKQPTAKQIEMTLWVPPRQEQVRMRGRLEASALGLQWNLPEGNYQPLAPHEYHLVVLSNNPRQYAFLRHLNSVAPPNGREGPGVDRYYLVLMPPADKPVPLSSQALTWTSLAYLIWDDLSPSRLSEGQQQALLDWLHWGGQLIVSGPDSLDTLRASFLAPYLPAESQGTATLNTADLAPFSAAWTLPTPRGPGRPIQALHDWSGVRLQPRETMPGVRVLAATSSEKPLVVEGSVGRGRIVVTGFRLSERELVNWPSFDDFFNACLLRRQPRQYSRSPDEEKLVVDWSDKPGRRLDPRRIAKLRFFSRDAGYAYAPQEAAEAQAAAMPPAGAVGSGPQPASQVAEALPPLGLGAWNDQAPVPVAARGVLRDAAGIDIPSASFVAWVLAGYLLVLVPLNWGLFRIVGRIEWAWIAAPLIAIGGTAVVVRLAQLDIGFVRSVTHVGVLETQPGYARGHLARFSALYTSLSTGYDFTLDDPAGLMQPFSTADGPPLAVQSPQELQIHRNDKATLTGFHVLSNRADLVRSEQWLVLGGPIQLSASQSKNKASEVAVSVENHSQLDLRHAIVVRRSATTDRWDVALLGDMAAGRNATASFGAVPRQELIDRWDQLSSVRIGNGENRLSLRRLLSAAVTEEEIRPGAMRLFATIEAPLPGLAIAPQSNQVRQLTLVVANLRYAPAAAPERDRNTRQDILGDAPQRQRPDEPEATGLLP